MIWIHACITIIKWLLYGLGDRRSLRSEPCDSSTAFPGNLPQCRLICSPPPWRISCSQILQPAILANFGLRVTNLAAGLFDSLANGQTLSQDFEQAALFSTAHRTITLLPSWAKFTPVRFLREHVETSGHRPPDLRRGQSWAARLGTTANKKPNVHLMVNWRHDGDLVSWVFRTGMNNALLTRHVLQILQSHRSCQGQPARHWQS